MSTPDEMTAALARVEAALTAEANSVPGQAPPPHAAWTMTSMLDAFRAFAIDPTLDRLPAALDEQAREQFAAASARWVAAHPGVNTLPYAGELLAWLQLELDRARTNAPEDTSDGYHTFRELYEYRLLYNAGLFNEWADRGVFDVHMSVRHSDGELCFGGGWFVVVAQLPTGQISNHYREDDRYLFADVPYRDTAAAWDGHTPAVAAQRLRAYLAARAA